MNEELTLIDRLKYVYMNARGKTDKETVFEAIRCIEADAEDIKIKDRRIERLEESVLSLQEYKDKYEGLCK